jgi:cold shock CspA family protein
MKKQQSGKVSRIVHERGFGFITPDDGPALDHFFLIHWVYTLPRGFHDLQIGDRVTFIPMSNDKGPRAVEVRALEAEPA